MNTTRWAAVAALLAAGLGTPAATATVTSQATPTAVTATVVSLTGIAAPTHDAVATPGSVMSTYGHLKLYDSSGKVTPLVNRFVYVETRPLSTPSAAYEAISTGKTTATGYYFANWRSNKDVQVRVTFAGGGGLPSKITYLGEIRYQPRPSFLDGVTRPTKPTSVIHLDTRMSTFGHLRVQYSNGQIGPYAGQRVRVTMIEAVEPYFVSGPGPEVVGEAVTTSTGYFYTTWTPRFTDFHNKDVIVQLVFAPGYQSVAKSVVDLGVIHVQ